jgi:phage gp29-like protein
MTDPTQNTAPIRDEVATTGDGKDITRPFFGALLPLPVEDSVLRERSGGDYKLYMEVLRDDHVKAAIEQRRRAVIARPWEVRPGGKRAIDKAAAAFLEENINAIGWDTICDKMLMGVFYGFAVGECMWVPDGRFWRLDQVIVRNRRRFNFNNSDQLQLRTMSQPLGTPLPDRKFWVFATGADHDDAPYGLGLAHWLYWPVWFKRNGWRLWAVFLEKFGTPAVKGTYPAGTDEAAQEALLTSLRAMRQDSAVVVPEGMAVELLEATRSGTADFKGFADAMDKAILVATVGQTATTSGTPGKLGSDQQQGEVRMDIVRADADLLSASFNRSVATWLTEWNFPGAAVPGIWRVIDEPEDLKLRSERDRNIFTMGYKPTLKYVTETYGGEWEDKPAPVVPPALAGGDPAAQDGGDPASFAEGQADPVTQMTGRMTADAAATMGDWLGTVREMLGAANSLGEFSEMLNAAYDKFGTTALETAMTDGFAAADLAGRFEAKHDD